MITANGPRQSVLKRVINMTQEITITSLIVAHPVERRFLLVSDKGGWILPRVSGVTNHDVMVGPIQQGIREQLGLNVSVGRQLHHWDDELSNLTNFLYEADLLAPQALPADTRWGGKEDISSIILALKEQSSVLLAWLNEQEVPSIRVPWFRTGWYSHAEEWIKTAVDGAGFKLTGLPEQVKASDFCTVQRIPTNKGDLYFKATGPAAQHEAILSNHLDQHYPGKSVGVLAIEPIKGWLLMKDIGGEPLRTRREKPLWQRAIQEYSELQVREVEHARALLTMGLPDRRITVLKAHIQEHLAAMCATGLDAKETAEVMALQPELLQMCDQMELGLPPTIDHGDLHSANIRLVDGGLVFFDWGDACVTHPFFSTRVFWNSLYDLISDDAEWLGMVNQFRRFYLEPWTKFAPMRELEELLAVSDQLACLHRALSWYLYLTPSREDKAESFRRPAQWLQVLLEHRAMVR